MATTPETKPLIFTVDDFLSPKECQDLIRRIEEAGCSPAPVTTARGFVMMPDVRNNDRTMFDDFALADDLYQRALPHLPQTLEGWTVCGVNERFRCYRYSPGQKFALHRDGTFRRSETERSFLTFMVYLNEGCTGGETAFPGRRRFVSPKTGMAIFFDHFILHEGREVKSGIKYVLRTDVMYRAPEEGA